ncbi:hypothetical protein P4S67_03975 [Pseudoalteromonas sp. B137]
MTLPIDFVINKVTPAASVITLTFDSKVDLDTLETLAGGEDEVVDIFNDITNGKGYVDFGGTGDATSTEVVFNYGTGSFTFDRFAVNADAGTITFEVNLGNAITADSAFRMTISGAAAGVDISGASSVAYSSVDSVDNAIETGVGQIATETQQFSLTVSTGFNGRIERLTQQTFAKNATDVAGNTDTLSTIFIDRAASLEASLTLTAVNYTVEGDFDNGVTASPLVGADFVADVATTPIAGTEVLTDEDTLTFSAIVADGIVSNGANNLVNVVFGTAAAGSKVIPQTGMIDLSATVSVSDAGVDPIKVVTDLDAGSWALDATVINIPYFPVGFDGLSTSVHFANESANDADVIVTAIDQAGNEYSGTMADLAGDTVTKYSQGAIMSALSAPAGSKLSVTFNIDANDGDVNAYAFSNAGTGRQALVTSQEKGIK